MSLNKSEIKDAVKLTFVALDGEVRAVWKFVSVLLIWHILVVIGAFGTSALLSALFDIWGVNTRTLHAAPRWVQLLAVYQTHIFYCVSSAAAALTALLLIRRLHRGTEKRHGLPIAGGLMGFLGGVFVATALALVFYLADCMRFETLSPEFAPDMLIMLVFSLVISLGEVLMSFGYVRECMTGRGGRLAGYVCSAVMFFLMESAYLLDWVAMLNTLLMAVMLAFTTEKLGVGTAVGLRAGWLWAISSLAAFPGGGNSMLTLYPVSENLLTGGDAGPMSGIMVTLICGAVVWLGLIRPSISGISKRHRENRTV